jgi:deoxyribodipyrimidine photo-lyase
MKRPSIVWFRKDLRLEDNAAFYTAAERDGPIIPLYIWAPEEERPWEPGGASRWWLHYSLESLSDELETLGYPLIIRAGPSLHVLEEVIKETRAEALFWNRLYEPEAIKRDTRIKSTLSSRGIDVQTFNASLLFEPWTIFNKQKKPFQVFTRFWQACLKQGEMTSPLPMPPHARGRAPSIKSLSPSELHLLPEVPWDQGISAIWRPGAHHARQRLDYFIEHALMDYKEQREFPGKHGVSYLSPYLHFGEISPRMIWHEVVREYPEESEERDAYLRQLGWREFAHHLLYHFPFTPTDPLRREFSHFPWHHDDKALKAWQTGYTGYPLVDAGMRQLWITGWMHNRLRMVVGSFLVKDLLLPWQEGAKWFWDTLVDADLANNTLGWQWVAGCGADAAPYFRIFNPVTQGEKFDGTGEYVRRWVPELAKLPDEWIQQPWDAPPDVLKQAEVEIGKTYPHPIVDHSVARKRALDALKEITGAKAFETP